MWQETGLKLHGVITWVFGGHQSAPVDRFQILRSATGSWLTLSCLYSFDTAKASQRPPSGRLRRKLPNTSSYRTDLLKKLLRHYSW